MLATLLGQQKREFLRSCQKAYFWPASPPQALTGNASNAKQTQSAQEQLRAAAEMYKRERPGCMLTVEEAVQRLCEAYNPDESPYVFDAAACAATVPRDSGARKLRAALQGFALTRAFLSSRSADAARHRGHAVRRGARAGGAAFSSGRASLRQVREPPLRGRARQP